MQGKIEVFYDSGCGLCVASRRWAEARDRGHRLVFRDFTAPALQDALPADRSELANEMVVRVGGSRLLKGFDAWLAVLSALPHWRWPAHILAVVPFRWIGPPAYRFVARHRRVFPWTLAGGCSADACGHEPKHT
ncbi:MAG: thiol-disulfide oxidoreductase DCC family protein [Thermoanaerobaculales bacterium]